MTATLEHQAPQRHDEARELVFQPEDVPVGGEHGSDSNLEDDSAELETATTPDRRPRVSPLARALDRVAASIDEHAMDRIHGKALKENEAMSTSPAVEYTQEPLWHDDSDNLESEKEERRQNRAETRAEILDKSKNVLKNIGRRTLDTLKNTGRLTLGIGVLAGQAGAKGVERGTKAAASAIESSKQARQERKISRIEAKKDRKTERYDRKIERLNEKRAEAQRLAAEANARKEARHAKWKARKERVIKGYESTVQMGRNGKARVGRVATRTRRFGARARAAGSAAASAAKTAWNNFE